MNNRDIAKVGFAVLAAVMSYNFADTIVHAEETSVEPVKETAPVENQDDLTDVINAVVEDTNVPEENEETDVDEVFENILGFLKKANATKNATLEVLKEVEKEKAKQEAMEKTRMEAMH